MDIQKFNQELAKKVRKAQSYERANNIEHAIQAWLEISELVLNVSKTPKLPFSYKSMLVKKTEQIMAHIKTLDAKITKEVEVEPIVSEREIVKEEISTQLQEPEELSKTDSKQDVITDESITNMPEGFTEIKASEDFKIVTPHDEEYINKILSMDPDAHEIGIPSKSEPKADSRSPVRFDSGPR